MDKNLPQMCPKNQEVLFEVAEAASLLGCPERTVKWRIKSGSLAAVKTASRGRSGFKYLIPLSSLPPSKQAEYLKNKGIVEDQRTESVAGLANPAPLVSSTGVGGAQVRREGSGVAPSLPAWAEREALARADLLHAFEKARTSGRPKMEAMDLFLAAYNTGRLAPAIFETLGTVSRGTLYRWADAFAKAGEDYRALAPEWGNSRGRTKVMEHEATLLLNILLTPQKRPVETAIKLMKYVLEDKGIPSPSSAQTLRRYIDKYSIHNRDLWVMMREGEKALNDKCLPYIKRDASMLEVGDVLVADGHRLNFLVINPWTGKPCRATLIGYQDWASRYLCGYEVMVEETTQAVAGALRNAILTLGKYPAVTYQDNGKSFKNKFFQSEIDLEQCGIVGLFASLGIKPVFSKPYNAQAKVIERFWGTFGDQCERMIESYTGASIGDKPAWMMRNEKFHKNAHKDFIPTIPQAVDMIGRWLEFHHSQPHKGLGNRAPREVFEAGRGPGVDARVLDGLMMSAEVTKVTREGIRWRGLEYWSDSLYGYAGRAVIRYSLFDIEQVHVYLPGGEFLCSAELKTAVHAMASLSGRPVDMEVLGREIRRKAQLKKQTLKVVGMHVAAGLGTPDHLITGPVLQALPDLPRAIEAQAAHMEAASAPRVTSTVTSEEAEAAFAKYDRPKARVYQFPHERYDALKEKKEPTPEERRWMEEFLATDSARMMGYTK